MIRALLVLSLVVAAACGGGLKMESLIGEDAEIRGFLLDKKYPPEFMSAAQSIQKLYKALQGGKCIDAWKYIGARTRGYFEQLANKHGRSSARELLCEGQVAAEGDQLIKVDMSDWLLMPRLYTIADQIPGEKPQISKSEMKIYLFDKQNNFRAVRARLEDGTWRVDPEQPSGQ